MSEPLFDPSLKKRKKKQVAFTEDPLGPDADPTAPAPDSIDTRTTSGDVVDLGPTTAHEAMKRGASEETDAPADDAPADAPADAAADPAALFGDLKKKKKKKEIPMDLDDASGTSTPVAPPAAAGEDLDFSDIKKKKKSTKKKAAFDLEAFEKELNDAKAPAGEDDDDDGPPPADLDLDDADLGEDPFASHDAPAGTDSAAEPWLGSDRDYTYSEVRTYSAC